MQVVVSRWDSKMDLMVVPLDDFDIILGNDFFIAAKVAILPCLYSLLISNEEKPSFVVGYSLPIDAKVHKSKVEMVFIMQLARG